MADDPIQHVVVLMLENRSFDHMLGALGTELGFDGLNDADPPVNLDNQGVAYRQTRGASPTVRFDPKHDLTDVRRQLGTDGQNAGFVKDFESAYPASDHEDRAEIMKCHTNLTGLHDLARSFLVCDGWYASVPGPTWPNRFFVHSGTSLGRVLMPVDGTFDTNLHWYDQTTIYDRLNEGRKRWRIYYGDIPQSLLLIHQLLPWNALNYRSMNEFYENARGAPDEFPEYCFIEPTYYGSAPTDDHPTHNVMGGDQLLRNVYNALRANEPLWKSSLLVVLFDEHGGFYDHRSPPSAVAPDSHHEEYTFDRLGVRVPALLISPYVKQGFDSTPFDHTSLLKYLVEKWGLGPLGERTAAANSIGSLIGSQVQNYSPWALGPDGPLPQPAPPSARSPHLNSHQTALVSVGKLIQAAGGVATEDIEYKIPKAKLTLDDDVDGAIASVESFLLSARKGGPSSIPASASKP